MTLSQLIADYIYFSIHVYTLGSQPCLNQLLCPLQCNGCKKHFFSCCLKMKIIR